jgi:hypothetical protein
MSWRDDAADAGRALAKTRRHFYAGTRYALHRLLEQQPSGTALLPVIACCVAPDAELLAEKFFAAPARLDPPAVSANRGHDERPSPILTSFQNIPIPPQPVGSCLVHRTLGLIVLGCWVFWSINPLEDGMHQIAKPGVIASAELWHISGGVQPVEREMHHKLVPGFVVRSAAPVISGTGAADLTHDHWLKSDARTLAAASTPAGDGALALSAQYTKRGNELLVSSRASPCKEPSCQTVRRIKNALLDGLAGKQARDHHPRTATHMFNGPLREFSEFLSQHLDGGLVEMAALPQRS